MQLLLSCAKTMTERSSVPTPRTTRPAYRSEASELAAGLATLPDRRTGPAPGASTGRIAAENRLRYGRFHGDDDAAIPALTAYTGIVFKRIDPASFTDADFEYAQRHLNITSFLYGLLRPLDAIRTYRLEGDAVLPGRGDANDVFLLAKPADRRPAGPDSRRRRHPGQPGERRDEAAVRLETRLPRSAGSSRPEFRVREGDG